MDFPKWWASNERTVFVGVHSTWLLKCCSSKNSLIQEGPQLLNWFLLLRSTALWVASRLATLLLSKSKWTFQQYSQQITVVSRRIRTFKRSQEDVAAIAIKRYWFKVQKNCRYLRASLAQRCATVWRSGQEIRPPFQNQPFLKQLRQQWLRARVTRRNPQIGKGKRERKTVKWRDLFSQLFICASRVAENWNLSRKGWWKTSRFYKEVDTVYFVALPQRKGSFVEKRVNEEHRQQPNSHVTAIQSTSTSTTSTIIQSF